MWVRVRMVGTGVEGDPFRAPLPGFRRLIRDDETPLGIGAPRWCLIDLPDRDYIPEQGAEAAPLTVNVAGIGLVVRRFDPTHKARLIARIKEAYRERANEYNMDEQ